MATALVTGGAIHVGREICLYLADRGYDIALHYNTSDEDAKELADYIEAKGRECFLFEADFSKCNAEKLLEKVIAECHDLTLLVNSASVFEKADIDDTELVMAKKTFDVNFMAPFVLMRDFAKNVKEGLIINVLDQSIRKSLPKHVLYSVSKSALATLTKAAAMEFAPGIRVCGIAPGIIVPHTEEDVSFFYKQKEHIPLKKAGSIHSLTTALAYIIDNDFVTGDIMFVDGGQSIS